MVNKLTYIESEQYNPYKNLGSGRISFLPLSKRRMYLISVAESAYGCDRPESECMGRMSDREAGK